MIFLSKYDAKAERKREKTEDRRVNDFTSSFPSDT